MKNNDNKIDMRKPQSFFAEIDRTRKKIKKHTQKQRMIINPYKSSQKWIEDTNKENTFEFYV